MEPNITATTDGSFLLEYLLDVLVAQWKRIHLQRRRLPIVQRTWAQSLGQEDPLEKEMAAHSNILAWEIPWTEEPGRLQSMGSKKSGTT